MTNPYHILIAPSFQRQTKLLQPKQRKNITKLAEALAINPRPPGAEKVTGMNGLYSETVDHLRIIYKIEDQEILLLLIK